jgi:hypothetical protein
MTPIDDFDDLKKATEVQEALNENYPRWLFGVKGLEPTQLYLASDRTPRKEFIAEVKGFIQGYRVARNKYKEF